MSFVRGISKSLNNTQSEEEVGIGGYRLFARVSDSVSYKNTVPTDTLEDGSNASDDIINEPITISIEGVVGDLLVEPLQSPAVISKDFSSVGEITALLPSKSQQQIQRISQIDDQIRDVQLQAERAERVGGKAYEFFNNSANTAKGQQEKFIDYIEAVNFSRNPIEVSVNFRNYQNMAITSLDIRRDNQVGDTSFSITFQQVEFTTLVYTAVSSPAASLLGKVSDAANKGGQNPEVNETRSLLSSLIGG